MASAETDYGPRVETYFQKAKSAAAIFSQLGQEQTDRISLAVRDAGFNNRVRLAKMAAEETGIGKWPDKVVKNAIATMFVWEDIRNLTTAGVISDDPVSGIVEIAQPMGPILAIIPVTNPTATVLFKTLICMKTRNPIIICPSPRAKKSCMEAARLCYEAALSQGAPDDCVQWVPEPVIPLTQALMSHKALALILATGGAGLVKSAYSSGTPTLGVGSGNVPVYIEAGADIPFAVEQIFISKLFDNGTICASEQAIVVEKSIAGRVADEVRKRGGYFLSEQEVAKLTAAAYDAKKKVMNADIVGKSASEIAARAGINAPKDVRMLMAPLSGVGELYPLSGEILAPILAYYVADDFDHAVNLCIDLNFYGGIGHTVSMYSNDEEKIKTFAMLMNAGRIVVNTPSAHGAVGGIYNMLHPSLTLGCGTGGKNITTDNVTARHLINIQRIARRRDNLRLARFDTAMFLDESQNINAVEKAFNKNS
ncbi:MAG: aldehyde dehydrogenase family protein [Planctomycetes bacterium]|nr:aldehyde dehydrogenase family protein [Planctomycetota bacterium]